MLSEIPSLTVAAYAGISYAAMLILCGGGAIVFALFRGGGPKGG